MKTISPFIKFAANTSNTLVTDSDTTTGKMNYVWEVRSRRGIFYSFRCTRVAGLWYNVKTTTLVIGHMPRITIHNNMAMTFLERVVLNSVVSLAVLFRERANGHERDRLRIVVDDIAKYG